MKAFSNSIGRIGTENAFAVGPEIAAHTQKGRDIVKLTIGEPGCSIPKQATKKAIESLKRNQTHYTPSAGTDSIREKIADYLTATRKVNFQKENVALAPGGKPVIAGTILILVNPGDEVIYPTPCYPIYESMVDFVGAKTVPIQLKEELGFRFDTEELRKKVSNKTKLLILNSPSNPTGGVLQKNDLKEIARLAGKYDFYVLSDEIYSRMVFGENFEKINYKGKKLPIAPSIATQPAMVGRTIILDGFSKTYAMTGLRVGYAASKNKKFIDKFITFAINIWSCLPQPCMSAAEESLGRDQKEAQKEMALYQKKRDVAVDMLNKIEGVKCHQPEGSFYLFVNVSKVIKRLKLKDVEALRKYLLVYDKKNKKGVAVLTRNHFGRRLKNEKEEYIRISIAGNLKDIREGITRIKNAVER